MPTEIALFLLATQQHVLLTLVSLHQWMAHAQIWVVL
jgi:hypothetical protein